MLPFSIPVLLALATPAATAIPESVTPQNIAPTQQDGRLPIVLDGRMLSLQARLFRPRGPGPFPLVVINHGTPADKTKLPDSHPEFSRAARWFADRGFLVVVALRPGFGTSEGPYLEGAGRCEDEDYVLAARRIAAIEAAIVRASQLLPDVMPDRVLVVGQSAGGFGAVALGDAPPPGVRGIVSFAGGRGGNGHEHICAGEGALIAAENVLGRANRLPQLWLYAANDHFFRPELAHRMADAFAAGSRPRLDFADLPPFDDEGHHTFAQAQPDVWAPYVERFLATIMPR